MEREEELWPHLAELQPPAACTPPWRSAAFCHCGESHGLCGRMTKPLSFQARGTAVSFGLRLPAPFTRGACTPADVMQSSIPRGRETDEARLSRGDNLSGLVPPSSFDVILAPPPPQITIETLSLTYHDKKRTSTGP